MQFDELLLTKKTLEDGINYLSSSDGTLQKVFKVIVKIHLPEREPVFIINQQLSGKAASTIFGRVVERLGDVTPESILTSNKLRLRKCGISKAKVDYIVEFAKKCSEQPDYLEKLSHLSNDQVSKEMRTNKGIGDWSSSVFLLFCLRRRDIFPFGDVTLGNAICELYKLRKGNTRSINKISSRWAPYRSVASLALWKWIDQSKPKLV